MGIALIFLPPAAQLACFFLFVFLETGHSLSPIVLAWTHAEFRRRVIYSQPLKFLLWPSLVFSAALAIGIATQAGWTSYSPGPGASGQITGWDNPFPLLVWFYSAWNLYHFAMQDFGVLMFCTGPAKRRVKRLACLVGLIGIYLAVGGVSVLGFWHLPGLVNAWWTGPLMIGAVSVNHWVVDIGLSSRVAKRSWVFIAGVLAVGVIGFVWIVPTSYGMMIRVVPAIICARLGLGFVHFLYSRWVWKLGDPQVRATIGKDLFATPPSGFREALATVPVSSEAVA